MQPRQPRIRERLNPLRPLRNRRGVALMLAVAAVSLIAYLAMEVMYDASVEYTVNSQNLNRLKAYYAARSGLEISLLRIKIYQSVQSKFGAQLSQSPMGDMSGLIDQIWQFPLSWPLVIPEGLNMVDKESLESSGQDSIMDATFSTDIRDEGSKIDLYDLVSPSKTLREITKRRLLEIFENKIKDDEEWRREYGNFRAEELINSIADWMSTNNASLNGGDKRQGYEELNRDREAYPPNRGFRTLDELRLVKGMTDDFFDLLEPRVTIYGMRGVNPNVASEVVLMSLDPGITEEVARKIIQRREDPQQGGPFRDKEGFWGYVEGEAGGRLQNENSKEIPLVFDRLTSFKIVAKGKFASSERVIEAIVVDLDQTAKRIKEFVDKDKQAENPTPTGTPTTTPTSSTSKNEPLPKGPPRIVYWYER